MSFQQKKKIIDKLILDENIDLELEDDQQIVIYLGPAGVNIHRVIPLELCPDMQVDSIPESSTAVFLVSMPKKYRGLQYLKKCDLLIIDKIVEGKKVLGEVNCIISKDHVLNLYRQKLWPLEEHLAELLRGSPDGVTEWTSKFDNAFVMPPAPRKDRSCAIPEDFVSSEDESEEDSEISEEEDNHDEDQDCDFKDREVKNTLMSAVQKQPGVLTSK